MEPPGGGVRGQLGQEVDFAVEQVIDRMQDAGGKVLIHREPRQIGGKTQKVGMSPSGRCRSAPVASVTSATLTPWAHSRRAKPAGVTSITARSVKIRVTAPAAVSGAAPH